jgi:hypothetical protein
MRYLDQGCMHLAGTTSNGLAWLILKTAIDAHSLWNFLIFSDGRSHRHESLLSI